MGTTLGSSLLLVVLLLTLGSTSVESEITTARGCRYTEEVLMVDIQRDNSVRWPNGDTCMMEVAVHELPGWVGRFRDPVLAVKADKDILISTIHPLLNSAKELGMKQIILAASGQGPVRIYRR